MHSESLEFVFAPMIYGFIVIPIFDSVPYKSQSKWPRWALDGFLYFVCFSYLLIWAYFIFESKSMPLELLIYRALNLGVMGGVIGINCAHELGHRFTRWEQNFSKVLLFTTQYMHFFIEHNRGHHRNVGTHEDPATARFNEWVYAFIPRSMFGTWYSSYKIEGKRKSFFSNKAIQWTLLQWGFLVVLALWSFNAFIAAVIYSVMAIFLLETVNYVEHYGLSRELVNGRPVRVTPKHSWNSNHFMSRAHLFELSRHSDHHADAKKPFMELQSLDEAPQLPAGYASMVLLALLPPLWFSIMNRRVLKYQPGADRVYQ
tara:strand:+ start:682 stop:1626 length:945 start_codon:yes stop_codon:yes gene_type:complete